jgi:microcystin-dependent protein
MLGRFACSRATMCPKAGWAVTVRSWRFRITASWPGRSATPSGATGRPISACPIFAAARWWVRARKVGESGRALAVRDPDVLPLTLALNYLINPESRSGSALFAEVRPFAFGFVPRDWEICDGRVLRISQHNILFAVIGPRFGGDARDTFALPDLRSYTPLNHGDGPGLTPAPMASHRQNLAPGGPSRRPRLHVNYCIATQGEFPSMR